MSDKTNTQIDISKWPESLNRGHIEVLSSRAVSPDVARSRGYRTSNSRSELSRYGFSRSQTQVVHANGPGALMIPLYRPTLDPASGPSSWQMRPDEPRYAEDRPLKYESPGKSLSVADVHPDHLSSRNNGVVNAIDPTIPLLITEGIPKADAVYSAALAIDMPLVTMALTGVTMWSKKTPGMFRVLSDDVKSVARPGRMVFLAFDGDWRTNPNVRRELNSLALNLIEQRECEVFITDIPNVETLEKTGIDDWLNDGGSLEKLLSDHSAPFEQSDLSSSNSEESREQKRKRDIPFIDTTNLTIHDLRERPSTSDYTPPPEEIELASFIARIESVVTESQIKNFELEQIASVFVINVSWKNSDGVTETRRIRVPTTEIYNLRKWATQDPGVASRYISPKFEDERRIVSAILHFSEDQYNEESNCANSGWHRDIRTGKWRYVASNGFIGANGDNGPSPSITSDANASNTRFLTVNRTPDADPDRIVRWTEVFLLGDLPRSALEPFGNSDKDVSRLSLPRFLTLGVMWVARGLVPGAPLSSPLYLVGSPRTGKTMFGRVWSSHFGQKFASVPFAGLTSSTPAGVEAVLQSARGFSAVIDDFIVSDQHHTQSMSSVIDRATRHAHDGSGRIRSSRTLRAVVPAQPEVTLAFTGEDLPSLGHSDSLVSRLLTLRIPRIPPRGVLDWAHGYLRDSQMLDTANTAMSSMISWVAEKLDSLDDMSSPETTVGRMRRELESDAWDIVEQFQNGLTQMEKITLNDRTVAGLRSLSMGGALLIKWLRDRGYADEESIDIIRQNMFAAMRMVMTSSVSALSSTTPAELLAQRIPEWLASGKMHITTPEGGPPDDPLLAYQWGWRQQDDRIVPSSHHIGIAVGSSKFGKPAVCIFPSALASAIPSKDELGFSTTRKIGRLLSEMTYSDPDGNVNLIRIDVPQANRQTSFMNIDNQRWSIIALDAEQLGVSMPPGA